MSDLDDLDEIQPVEPALDRREREYAWRRRRSGVFFPLLLITLGVIFLLRNAGVLPGSAWDTLISLWPLIFVALGIDSLLRGQGIAGPLFWIGLGAALTLSNLDLWEVNTWQLLFNLWPVFLIAIGLDIVVGRRSVVGAVIALVILAVVVAGAVWFMGSGSAAGPEEIFSENLGGATRAEVSLQPAVGTLLVNSIPSGTYQDELVRGNLHTDRNAPVKRDLVVEAGAARLTLEHEGGNFMFPGGQRSNWNWNLHFNPAIPLDLDASMGAGEMRLELINLKISDLNVSQGLGRVYLVLPDEGGFSGSISGAIGEMTIYVPAGVQVRIEADTALTVVDMPDHFIRQDNIYTSPGFASAGPAGVSLKISQAIGKVTVISQ